MGQLLERLRKTKQKVADVLLDLASRPLSIRRERHGNKVIYRFKKKPEAKTTKLETESETIFIDDYGLDESSQVVAEDME